LRKHLFLSALFVVLYWPAYKGAWLPWVLWSVFFKGVLLAGFLLLTLNKDCT